MIRYCLSIARLTLVAVLLFAPFITHALNQERQVFTGAELALAQESKAVVITSGISEPYFQKHFTLLRVVDTPGDRRVLWKFSFNEYETTVSDVIGYYTDRGKRINVHSITNLLSSAHEIHRTLPRKRAEQLMRACIGDFEGPSVIYQSGPAGPTLVLNAEAKIRDRRSREEREKQRKGGKENLNREKEESERQQSGEDFIEQEGAGGGPQIVLGSINVETGKCVKGRALATP